MLRVIFKRGLLTASVVLTIALVCLSIRSIWFAGDELLLSTGGDFQLLETPAPRPSVTAPTGSQTQRTHYSLLHQAGSLRFHQVKDVSRPLRLQQRDVRYYSGYVILRDRPHLSPPLDREYWWRWVSSEHGFAMMTMGFVSALTLPHDTSPGEYPPRRGLMVQLPLPLLALIAATPALFWLWRRLRRGRREGFEVTPVPAAGADAPPGTHQGDEGLVRPPGGGS